MSAIKKGAAAPAIPSLYVLKGEAIHMRAEAKAGGQTMGHRTALKKVAIKYGFRSWEALEAAARVSEANQGHQAYTKIQSVTTANIHTESPSVKLLEVDFFNYALIVNRAIVGSYDSSADAYPLEDLAERLAKSLGVQLEHVHHATAYGDSDRGWTFKKIAEDLDLIDREQKPEQIKEFFLGDVPATHPLHGLDGRFDGFVTPIAHDEIRKDAPLSFDQVVAIAQDFEEFEISHDPHIDFEILLDTEPHPDKGDIDYMVSVTLSVESGKPIWARYCAYVRTEFEGRIDALPPGDIYSKAQCEVETLLENLIEHGVDIDMALLTDESQGKTFDPQRA